MDADARITALTKSVAAAFGVTAALIIGCADGGKNAEPNREGPAVTIASPASVHAGDDFITSVRISNVRNLGGFAFTLSYDPTKVSVVSEEEGSFLSSTGRIALCQTQATPTTLAYTCATKEPPTPAASAQAAATTGPSGEGELAQIHLRAGAAPSGTIELALIEVNVVNPSGEAIQTSSSGTNLTIE